MPVYYIKYPEDSDERAVLSNLIGSLEKMFGMETFDAIGVVLPVGDPAGELIRSLARDVIPERATFADLTGVMTKEDARQLMADDTAAVFEPLPVLSDPVEMAVSKPRSKISKKARKCLQCNQEFLPAGNRQTFCSKRCRIAASASGNGSGVKHGKLVSYAG